MVSCFPCGGLQPETALLNDCYPPSKALATAGPEYKPLSSDLSKLTYRCTNQSSKLAKVGEELEKRVGKEAVRSTGGHVKYRASLLISLAILRALISECRRDLSLFSRSIIRIINLTLDVKVYQKGQPDLEVIGRSASCFTAFTTYLDTSTSSLDDSFSSTYLIVLRKFSALATTTGPGEKDGEEVARTRLIALAALNGAAGSDALFATSSNRDFEIQTGIIIPALLVNIFEGEMGGLKLETAKIEMDASPSPFFSEFAARRPVVDRRAPSLHAHIPGEKGPSSSDVTSAALRSLYSLVRQCQVNQASVVLDAVVGFLDKRGGWMDVERCCWLAERLTGFMTLQYRFVVPTRLAEMLVDEGDEVVSPKQTTLIAMITTVLDSPISLVGLGVSDLLNNLVAVLVRRVRVNRLDVLLPPLVQCVASLGTHIYYADQINDIVEELAIRMGEIQQTDPARSEILRVIIYCMIGVMTTAVAADVAEARNEVSLDKGKGPQVDTPLERRATGRRNPISPQVWQDTLPLLCESTFAVRAAYARALILFLENEMPREKKSVTTSRPNNTTSHRFCNAVHAVAYTLAMSSCLGVGAETNSPVLNQGDSTGRGTPETRQDGKGVSFAITEPTPIPTPNGSNGTSTPPSKPRRGSRRVSLPLNRLNSSLVLSSFDNVATPFDFAAIVRILDALHRAVPSAALSTGVPMLLALDRDAGEELVRRPGDGRAGAWVVERKRCIREVVGIMWRRIGERWGLPMISQQANKALNSLPEPFEVPDMEPSPEGILPLPEQPVQFTPNTIEGESSTTSQPLLDPEILVSALANSQNVLDATGREGSEVVRRLADKWTVEIAIKDSVERFSSAHVKIPNDPHFDVASVLMNLNNPSYQSLGRQPKVVDVSDLREALGGRTDTITTSSPPSIISTSGGRSIVDPSEQPRKRQNQDVKEVLKDILKDKKKASSGKKVNGHVNGMDKASIVQSGIPKAGEQINVGRGSDEGLGKQNGHARAGQNGIAPIALGQVTA